MRSRRSTPPLLPRGATMVGNWASDGSDEIHTTFAAAGATMVGNWASDGSDDNHTYDFVDSKSCTDGVFLGLPLDFDNEDDLNEPRIAEWVGQLEKEFA